MKKILLCILVVFLFMINLNAECKNESLNEWATTAEVQFNEITTTGLESSEFAYVLSLKPERDDIRIVLHDSENDEYTSKKLYINEKDSVIGVGLYTNLEEETYTLEIYGAEGTACEKELLKTLKYTVPRFNRFVKDRRCIDNDSELCKTFTNSTKDMSTDDFNTEIKKEEQQNNALNSEKLLEILKYSLFVVVPLAIVSLIYVFKIGKYQKAERDK